MNINYKNHQKTSGFTIVELLVVIVVIGILAALSIVSYTGITQRAATVTLKSDLKNSSTQLALYNTTNGIYPADLAAATTANVLPKSPDTTYQYTLTGSSYCLSATSPKAGATAYHYSSLVGTIEDGVCSGHIAPGVATTVNIEVLVVAGGGGGGGEIGGGGGGGGVVYDGTHTISLVNYGVIVGNGGLAGVGTASMDKRGLNGENSSFDNLVAIGGGGGGGNNVNSYADGKSGGSGGGAGEVGYAVGAMTMGQGNIGGIANSTAPAYGSGGGGGASSAGGAGSSTNGGSGGTGFSSSISGTSLLYGGGGGGAIYTSGTVGIGSGGGGNGAKYDASNATSGMVNTGGGGGGNNQFSATGIGGSGVVIIRHKTSELIGFIGGIITIDGLYTVHTFTENGSFRQKQTNETKVDVLIVAGGGVGGQRGGGGAGGLIYKNEYYIARNANYQVSVGNGGVNFLDNGSDSSFDSMVAIGGGSGGYGYARGVGSNGGSGGGGISNDSVNQVWGGGSGVTGQGYGGGVTWGLSCSPTGGGGGAGARGNDSNGGSGGAGGVGRAFDISGVSSYYAGGGGGGSYCTGVGIGGLGGGGIGSTSGTGTSATPNTGGGGGGGLINGAGGSGIVIIRYLTGSMSADGGAETSSGLYTIRTFTSSGTFTVN